MKKAPILGLILLLIPGVLFSAPALYEEGTHYVELQIPIRTRTPDKVEVTEFFSYGCPACFLFDSKINEWASGQDDDVVFNRTPATWNRDYLVFAQTYYTAEVMGILDQAHTALFRAIHLQQKQLNDPQEMARFFSEFGVEPVDFARVYNSFGIRASVQQAEARGRGYRSASVPSIIVNGKYRIEGDMAGGNDEMLKVADFLVARERSLLIQESEMVDEAASVP